METFTEKAVKLIQRIPAGRVMTYGQIAAWCGSPRGARQVVRILHAMSKKYKLPWHRVVNSKGEIGFQDDAFYQEQLFSLQSEGIEPVNGRIDLEKYRFEPEIEE